MAVEIEAKMRLEDRPALEARLQEAGGQRVAELVEVNTFFDTPGGDLRAGDQGLRVRLERTADGASQRAIITHKGPRAQGRLKTRQETEVDVADARAAAELLAALGFVRVVSFEKRRQRWKLEGCNVEIDALPFLGEFVEIEGPSEKTIMAVRETLGLGDSPVISASYISMLLTYLSENEIHLDHIGFDASANHKPVSVS